MADSFDYRPNIPMAEGMNFGMGGSNISDIKQSLGGISLGPQVSMTDQWANQGNFSDQFSFNLGNNPAMAGGKPGFFSMDSAFGYKDQDGAMHGGWAGSALGVLKSGLGFYLGSKQLDQAEDALAENKRQFDLNYGAQKSVINDQLRFQHAARTDRNSGYNGQLTQIA